ncbi:MAG: site-specific DNA-methyltransferase [Phycisphaerae bacterium]
MATACESTSDVLCAENLALMRSFPSASCDLIYVDPPFDLGADLPTNRNKPGLSRDEDNARRFDFLAFLKPRAAEMWRLLTERGSVYVHLDWRTVHHVKVLFDELFGTAHFLNEIIWSYRSGGRPGRWFPRKHDTLLLYAKSPGRHTFNQLRGGRYRTRDLKTTADGRPYKSTRSGPIYFDPRGPAISDVWDVPFLSTVSSERTDYPGQKPESLLERVVRASSNEGDLVADFFCGSGTTLVVAKRLRRRYLGCDSNPDAVAIARRRLAAVPDLHETAGA